MTRIPDPFRMFSRRVILGAIAALLSSGWLLAAQLPADAPVAPGRPASRTDSTTLVTPDTPTRIADRTFETSSTLRTEARYLVDLLEKVNYNRDAVHPGDYAEVLGDFMGELDGQRLFFLESDKTGFNEKYGNSLYYNVKNLGNIDASYAIFSVYLTRTQDRINWIFQELKKDMDLSTNEFYPVDRTKSEWPVDAAAADDLWRRRLKYEVLEELLNKQTATAADAAAKAPAPAGQPAAADAAGQPAATVASAKPAAAPDDPAKNLADAKAVIRKRYERMLKSVAELDGSDVSELFLTTITQLYDPHSSYFSADSFEDFGIQMKLRLVGIGAMLSLEDDYCVVKELVPGGPADISKALHPNDKIIAVAHESGDEPVEVIGMKLRKIVEMIRGDKGTKVHLTVQPADAVGTSTRKEVVLTRDVVKLNSSRAHAAIFDVPGNDGKVTQLGVITLPNFYNADDSEDGDKTSASQDVAELLNRLEKAGVKGVVLDLRHNGGGLLSEAIDLTGLFIGKGPVVQVKDYQDQKAVDSADSPVIAYAGPLAVLVDRFSASASEIVAGALQNYGRAIIIGDSSTHGKGTVQQIIEMRDFVAQVSRGDVKTGATKLTIQKFYLPDGSSTQLKGVVPDIVLPSIDDYMPHLGESDLPHALVWDKISSSFFDGKPLDNRVLTPLRESSQQRLGSLDEFTYLKRNIDWFKTREEQKLISLNLAVREKEKADDDAFRKQMNAERDRLAKNDYAYTEIRLGPPLPPKVEAPKAAEAKDGDNDDDELSTDENDAYAKVDIDLRESLRVIEDAISLSKSPEFVATGHAPLTAQVLKKG